MYVCVIHTLYMHDRCTEGASRGLWLTLPSTCARTAALYTQKGGENFPADVASPPHLLKYHEFLCFHTSNCDIVRNRTAEARMWNKETLHGSKINFCIRDIRLKINPNDAPEQRFSECECSSTITGETLEPGGLQSLLSLPHKEKAAPRLYTHIYIHVKDKAPPPFPCLPAVVRTYVSTRPEVPGTTEPPFLAA